MPCKIFLSLCLLPSSSLLESPTESLVRLKVLTEQKDCRKWSEDDSPKRGWVLLHSVGGRELEPIRIEGVTARAMNCIFNLPLTRPVVPWKVFNFLVITGPQFSNFFQGTSQSMVLAISLIFFEPICAPDLELSGFEYHGRDWFRVWKWWLQQFPLVEMTILLCTWKPRVVCLLSAWTHGWSISWKAHSPIFCTYIHKAELSQPQPHGIRLIKFLPCNPFLCRKATFISYRATYRREIHKRSVHSSRTCISSKV